MKSLLYGLGIVFASLTLAQVSLSTPILYNEGDAPYAVFNVYWPGWSNDRNHDAVWVFFKEHASGKAAMPIRVADANHQVVALHEDPVSLSFEVPKDRMGVYIKPSGSFQGVVHATVRIMIDKASLEGLDLYRGFFEAYALEMVKIPSGPLKLGTANDAAIEHGAFYTSDKSVRTFTRESVSFTFGPSGDFRYEAGEQGYEGDQTGTVPAAFPKGINGFYCMKYEISEGDYVNFLNALLPTQQELRTPTVEENYENFGGIRWDDNTYFTETPDVPCALLSWDDVMAYADWVGLRPMTELEFARAARGSEAPDAWLYPWGNLKKDLVQRWPDELGELTQINGLTVDQLSDSVRVFFSASYYWVMDLAGSKWERVVSVGHPKGRSFTGSHGDGVISVTGDATNADWPSEKEDGFGFRGGGFYGFGRDYHSFNPFSPVTYRKYGGWAGGKRTFAYGTRLVRSLSE